MPIDVAQRNAQEFGSCSFVSVYYAIADTLFNSEERCREYLSVSTVFPNTRCFQRLTIQGVFNECAPSNTDIRVRPKIYRF